jgi:hypothetical protein
MRSEPAEGKGTTVEGADMKECYRRRRVHSACGEAASSQIWGECLYLSVPGARSLGDNGGTARGSVTSVLLFREFACGWDVSEGTDQELEII